MSIEEGNKLIAEFLGMCYDKLGAYMKVWIHGDEPTFFHCEWHPEYDVKNNKFIAWEFAPDKNWCQLMPVVEKIEGLDFATEIVCLIGGGTNCNIFKGIIQLRISQYNSSKIAAVWNAVIQFIQWYNQKQSQ